LKQQRKNTLKAIYSKYLSWPKLEVNLTNNVKNFVILWFLFYIFEI